MKKLVWILVIWVAASSAAAPKRQVPHIISVRIWSEAKFYLGLATAQKPLGETVPALIKKAQALDGVNGTFFAEVYRRKGKKKVCVRRVPIGRIKFDGRDLSQCPAPNGRGYLWQTDHVEIGFNPPENALLIAPGGPILVMEGKQIWFEPPSQGFSEEWEDAEVPRVRTIIGLKGRSIFLIKAYGKLSDVAKLLAEKYHFLYAINFDGGSSSSRWTKVTNAIVVLPKSDARYQQYSKQSSKTKQQVCR